MIRPSTRSREVSPLTSCSALNVIVWPIWPSRSGRTSCAASSPGSRAGRVRARPSRSFHVATARALIADVPPLRNPVELKRMAMARLGKQVVDLERVTVSFDQRTVLDDVSTRCCLSI